MKTSDKLYKINALVSAQTYILKQPLSIKELENLNCELSKIIKEIRNLENEIKFR